MIFFCLDGISSAFAQAAVDKTLFLSAVDVHSIKTVSVPRTTTLDICYFQPFTARN